MERRIHWIAELGLPLPMNPPLERDRSPVAAAPAACSCRNPLQVADCIRARCAPGRRALRTPAGSGAQGAIKVRSVLSLPSPQGGERVAEGREMGWIMGKRKTRVTPH